MNKTLRISVIIPMRNAGKYIGECLDSVLSQTCRNLEVIIVDDGSDDDGPAVAADRKRMENNRNIKIIRQEKRGVSSARNVGIDAATGDFIHFVDADDRLAGEDFYEKVLSAAAGLIDIFVVGVIDEKRGAAPIEKFGGMRVYKTTRGKMLASGVARRPAVWRFVFRREFLTERGLRFEPGRVTSQDVMFSIPAVFYARAIATVPGAFYWYRRTPTGAMRDPARESERMENKRIVWERAVRFAIRHHFFLGFRRSFWKWAKLRFFE